jgi:hypothetical protein
MVITVLFLALTIGISMAAGVANLSWTDPNTRIDGSTFVPATDASKHTIYSSLSSNISVTNYVGKLDISATATSYTVSSLPSGTTYFLVTITDKYNQEGTPSNVGAKFIQPEKPSGCILTVN